MRAVAPFNWFGGIYKDSKQQIQVLATDPEQITAVYPELKIKPEEFEAWKHDRQGVIVGPMLANSYGWKVGDRIPMRSDIWRKTDGGDTWEFNIVGIYDASGTGVDKATRLLPLRLFQRVAAVRQGPGGLDGDSRGESRRVGCARGAHRCDVRELGQRDQDLDRTRDDQAVPRAGGQHRHDPGVGDLAVFFTMLLVTANTMAQSVRERTNEIGVLKTLGFSGRSILSLVLLESLLLTFAGGLLGLGLAWLAARGMGEAIKDYFPVFKLSARYVGGGRCADAGVRRHHRTVAGAHRDAAQDRRRAAARLRSRSCCAGCRSSGRI